MFSLDIAKKKKTPGPFFWWSAISRHPEKLHRNLVLDKKKKEFQHWKLNKASPVIPDSALVELEFPDSTCLSDR